MRFLFMISLVFSPSLANAQLLGIKTNYQPSSPIFPVVFCSPDLTGNTQDIDTVTWSIKCDMNGAIQSTFNVLGVVNDSNGFKIVAPHYGSHTVKCTITWKEQPGVPKPSESSKTLAINFVMPAASLIDANALNLPVGRQQALTLTFIVMLDDDIQFSYVVGWPQEHIVISKPDTADPKVIDWTPTTRDGLEVGKYWKNGNDIADRKPLELFDFQWDPLPIGETFAEYEQQNRLSYINCKGVQDFAYLSTHKIAYRKLSATSWQIEEH